MSWSVHANELIPQIPLTLHSGMYPVCLTREIRVERAHDDAFMLRPLVMQADEMLSVQSKDRARLGARIGKNSLISLGHVSLACFEHSQYIVTQPAQPFHYRQWEVLISLESGHAYAASFSRMSFSISSRCERA